MAASTSTRKPSSELIAAFARCAPKGHPCDSKALATLAQSFLALYSPKNPLPILYICWNHPWGIGDFVHTYDYAQRAEEVRGDESRIHIQRLCIISQDRLEQAKLFLSGVDPASIYLVDDEDDLFDPERARHSQYILWTNKKFKTHREHVQVFSDSENRELLAAFLREQQCVVNVSRPIDNADVLFILRHLSKRCHVQSFVEYGVNPDDALIKRGFVLVLHRKAMGLNATGIKFYEHLRTLAATVQTDEDKAQFLSRLQHESKEAKDFSNFLKPLMQADEEEAKYDKQETPEETKTLEASGATAKMVDPAATAFFARHYIISGHFQLSEGKSDFRDIQKSILSALGITDKPCILLFSSPKTTQAAKVFAEGYAYLGWAEYTYPLSTSLLALLKEHGVGAITIFDKDGKKTCPISDDSAHTRQLCFYDTPYLSGDNKDRLTLISHLLIKSGDSTISRLYSIASVSDTVFPYFQIRSWKMNLFSEMWREIQKSDPHLAHYILTLMRYVPITPHTSFSRGPSVPPEIFYGEELPAADYLAFIKKNHPLIRAEFSRYSKYSYSEHNVREEQAAILARALLFSILSSEQEELWDGLIRALPAWETDSGNFIFFAIATGNPALLQYLHAKDERLFFELLHRPYALLDQPWRPCDTVLYQLPIHGEEGGASLPGEGAPRLSEGKSEAETSVGEAPVPEGGTPRLGKAGEEENKRKMLQFAQDLQKPSLAICRDKVLVCGKNKKDVWQLSEFKLSDLDADEQKAITTFPFGMKKRWETEEEYKEETESTDKPFNYTHKTELCLFGSNPLFKTLRRGHALSLTDFAESLALYCQAGQAEGCANGLELALFNNFVELVDFLTAQSETLSCATWSNLMVPALVTKESESLTITKLREFLQRKIIFSIERSHIDLLILLHTANPEVFAQLLKISPGQGETKAVEGSGDLLSPLSAASPSSLSLASPSAFSLASPSTFSSASLSIFSPTSSSDSPAASPLSSAPASMPSLIKTMKLASDRGALGLASLLQEMIGLHILESTKKLVAHAKHGILAVFPTALEPYQKIISTFQKEVAQLETLLLTGTDAERNRDKVKQIEAALLQITSHRDFILGSSEKRAQMLKEACVQPENYLCRAKTRETLEELAEKKKDKPAPPTILD